MNPPKSQPQTHYIRRYENIIQRYEAGHKTAELEFGDHSKQYEPEDEIIMWSPSHAKAVTAKIDKIEIKQIPELTEQDAPKLGAISLRELVDFIQTQQNKTPRKTTDNNVTLISLKEIEIIDKPIAAITASLQKNAPSGRLGR